MHATRGRHGGLGLALLSACAFGGSGVAAKPLIEAGFDPLQVVWMRVAGAALILLPVAARHRRLPRARPGLLLGFGALAVAGCQGLYFVAISRIPVGVAILVEYLGPALLLGWVRFVQRRPVSRAAVIGVVLAVTGMACVVEVWGGLAFDPLGLLCAFGAACCQVAYFVLADQGTGHEDAPDPLAVVAYGLLVGAALLTVFARPWDIPFAALAHRAALGDRQVPSVLLLAWIVLVATVVAYLSGVIAVRRLSPQIAGVVACTEAVVGTVLAWFLLDEHLGAAQLVGGALVLAGAFAAQTTAKPAGSPPHGELPAAGAAKAGAAGAFGAAGAENRGSRPAVRSDG
ncbi:Threonine/homoserine efflux transporter RhtA [Streptomyces sp. DvalAA-14]|uniref:EamA family transporter n=1 Tax=unclassified Streptomyces TaxID=2593676 RepID=UPI00081B3704|nr:MULTISPECIES: EamA family transporter [unclassified Streptomyces]MYS23253.1 EamA family transporter [Streptomyces sp. SID4948]SCE30165.1 Threonine/homoserine efflux transporter RhtA [Streptomyces sp. DvalAA-14]